VAASLGCASAAVDENRVISPADAASELTPAACLSQSPVDLSIDLESAPPAFYVNELRLGYSRGEAIFLSRPLCDLYGEPLCRFVEAHEQAHHYTKTVGQKSICAETLADCWAAAHADDEAVEAALVFFRSRSGAGGYHGEPNVRADVIARCSIRWEKRKTLAIAGVGAADDPDVGQVVGVAGDSDRAVSAPQISGRGGRSRPFRVWGRAHR
jgi:hypothetical protein